MIPYWKFKRELKRLRRQAIGGPKAAVSFLFATPFYDLWLSKKRQTHYGSIGLGPSAVIYAIYPNHGILASHILALDMFIEAGYSPIVVSNLPIRDKDRAALLEKASVLIERPNVGYDFGAYRDGVLFLTDRLGSLDALAFFNDSTWFPLKPNENWLVQAKSLNADFVGATFHFGFQRTPLEVFPNVKWVYKRHPKNFHYASYALRLTDTAISDPTFLKFWKRMRLTSVKNKVVRRGETGLSRWLLKRRHSHDATHPMMDLDLGLFEMSVPELRATLNRVIILPEPAAEEIVQNIESDLESDGDLLRSAIMFVAARHGIAYALSEHLIHRYHFQFLKKSPSSMGQRSRRILRAIAEDLKSKGNGVIAKEILDAVERNE